jgi:hypothetical protein
MYSHRTPGLLGNYRVIAARDGIDWKPFEYNMTQAMEYMELAGYVYEVDEPEPEPAGIPTWVYLVGGVVVVVIGVGGYTLLRKK